ncbi:MAG: DNA-formamidopyrimidine glycosylase [Leptospirales bacterium]|nr:DNA-formamidopyrimidine glycosylase [Leptospirales bacterium]
MPELPDLEYVRDRLRDELLSSGPRDLMEFRVRQPVVIRNLSGRPLEDLMAGCQLAGIQRVGPFLQFEFGQARLAVHPMLAGAFRLAERPQMRALCVAFRFGEQSWLCYGDDKKMGKLYFYLSGQESMVPDLLHAGLPVLSPECSEGAFLDILARRRQQARAFLMDHSNLSAIGNAYADEILFEAGIHPKTSVQQLSDEQRRRLFQAVRSVLQQGIEHVRAAGRPIEEKVRDHMQVRNRKDQPCPRCGTRIRRANVLGYDAFFCPSCQPDTKRGFIDWRLTEA